MMETLFSRYSDDMARIAAATDARSTTWNTGDDDNVACADNRASTTKISDRRVAELAQW